MIGRRIAAAAALVTLATAGASAQSDSASVLANLPPRVGVSAAPPRALTLSDAIQLTLEGNNDVTIARLETQEARQDIRAFEGVFDTRLTPVLSYQRAVNPNASAIGGGGGTGRIEQRQAAWTFEVAGRAPWAGGRFAVDFTSSRIESSNQFARLNPQFPSSFGASYVQPLLRGRSIDAQRRQILLARRAADLTDAQLTQVLMDQVTLVEQAYWDLAFAARNLEVQAAALARAQQQVASNERQVREGTLAPIDVVEAQTQVANFQQGVAGAQITLTEAENRLKTLMLAGRSAPLWNQALVPTELEDRPVPAIGLEEAVRIALERRPELSALESTRAQNDIDREFFEDQARPQLDVVGTYSLAGLSGTGLETTTDPFGSDTDAAIFARLNELSQQAGLIPLDPPEVQTTNVPGFLVGNYSVSIQNLLNRRFPTALVQLQLDLPLRNRAAQANLARARLASTRLDRQRQQVEQAIEADVRNTLQAVASSRVRLDAAASARRNALEQYESERRRFEAGLSTVFLVLERQTAYVTAQGQELRARADLNQAIALLERATGGTLERHRIAINP
jgi:HAE1 family hydrophobic/amphiphilic exporter-1